jgi:hypothetical protein
MHQEPSGVWIMAYTTIDNPILYFSTNLWVADDASSRALTGFGHQPDLVWTKHRGSGSTYHTLTDSVRGGDKNLSTPVNSAESDGSHGIISSFDSDGITVIDGTNATYPRLTFNELDPFGASVGGNYVGWSWKAGGTASSNSDGSITSSVSASTTAGFSIVSYTGNATSGATIGHGLGVEPFMIIIKNRSSAKDWAVYHKNVGNNKKLLLNTTDAESSSSYFNSTSPTSTVFSVNNSDTTNDTNPQIAYCFAEKKGYSKFGSYTGNGNANGTSVYTGFRPTFVMCKRSSGTGNWQVFDSKREGFNVDNDGLQANLANAEATDDDIDILSTGFKLRGTGNDLNGSGSTYIYMAFAESPFVTAGTKAAGTAR